MQLQYPNETAPWSGVKEPVRERARFYLRLMSFSRIANIGPAIEGFCAATGGSVIDAMALPLSELLNFAPRVAEGPGRRRRHRLVRAPGVPDSLLPTVEKMRALFDSACRDAGKTPEEVEDFRLAVMWLRISLKKAHGQFAKSPIKQLEEGVRACVAVGLNPVDLRLEFGQSAKVSPDEDERRKLFFDFLNEIRLGYFDGMVLVCEVNDRLARMVSAGSLLVDNCERHGIDIFESRIDESVKSIKGAKWGYHSAFNKAQREWEDIQERARFTRDWAVRRGDLYNNYTSAMALVPIEDPLTGKIVGYRADETYAPIFREIFREIGINRRKHNWLTKDMNARARRGELPWPLPRYDAASGSLVSAKWTPTTLKQIVRSAAHKGCQVDSKGDHIRCAAIEAIVDDDLWQEANDELDRVAAEGPHVRSGPYAKNWGTGRFQCQCKSKAHGQDGDYRCSKKDSEHEARSGSSSSQRAHDGLRHFSFPIRIGNRMLKEVALALLETEQDAVLDGAALDESDEARERDRARLRAEQQRLSAMRQRVTDLHVAASPTGEPLITVEEAASRFAAIHAELAHVEEELLETLPGKRSILHSLRPGETWRTRWEAEEAREKEDGVASPWIEAVLDELVDHVEVACGDEWRGGGQGKAFHESRFTFVGANGHEINPGFVSALGAQFFEARLLDGALNSTNGWWEPPRKVLDQVLVWHRDEGMGTTKIRRALAEAAQRDPDYVRPEPGGKRKNSDRWGSPAMILRLIKKAYEINGVPFRPNGAYRISKEDRALMRLLVAENGEAAALRMFAALGKERPGGGPFDLHSLRRAIAVDDRRPGRPPKLNDDLLGVCESLQKNGKRLPEIQAFLADQNPPVHVHVATLSRQLRNRRQRRRFEQLDGDES